MRIFIDPKAILFLIGTELDFVQEKLGARFVFNNPNQTAACGCGESVSITPGRGPLNGEGDPDRFDDLFAPFGKIALRRMFGAEGLFRDGLMFGIVIRSGSISKPTKTNRQAFMAEGASPLYYKFKKAEGVLTSYYELPDRLYDDPDELTEWARTAFTVAQQSPSAAKKKTGSGRKARKHRAPPPKKRRRAGHHSPLKWGRASRKTRQAFPEILRGAGCGLRCLFLLQLFLEALMGTFPE